MPSPIDAPTIGSLDTPKSVILVMSVTSTDPEADRPSFASVTLTPSLLGRLDELDMGRRQLAASEIRSPADIQWGRAAGAHLDLERPELVLRGESTVWFSDTPRHSAYFVESQLLDLKEVRSIYDRSSHGQVVFMTTDTDVRHAYTSDLQAQTHYDALAILGLTPPPEQIDEACDGPKTPDTPPARLRLYRVTPAGFDDGPDGSDDHVIRHVVTHINEDGMRTLCGPAQGQLTYATYATAEEAEAEKATMLQHYRRDGDRLAGVYGLPLEVRPVKCYPADPAEFHNSSPVQVVFPTDDLDVRDAHASASLAQVQTNFDALAIQDVIEDVRERAKKYGFRPDEHTARDAVENSAELLGLTLSPAQIEEACAQLCGRETPSTPAADDPLDDPLRLYEVTAAGFDGGSDDTDDHVLWVLAPSAEVVQDAIQDTDATFCGEVVRGPWITADLADFKLPAQSMQLASALLEKASEHRNRNRPVG